MEALSAASIREFNQPGYQHAAGSSEPPFRLLLVHNGFHQFDQAIADLKYRDFPADTEVLLLSVAELFRAPLHLASKDASQGHQNPGFSQHRLPRHKKTQLFFHQLQAIQFQAYAKLQDAFPGWNINFERSVGWEPGLIFLAGFDSRSERVSGLSEIIRKVSSQSTVPLIVSRSQSSNETDRPTLIAIDGPASAAAILKILQSRPTDKGNDFQLMFYKDPLLSHAERWSAGYEERDRELIGSQLVKVKTAIEALGYKVTCLTAVGNTAQAVLSEAKHIAAKNIIIATPPLARLGFLNTETIALRVAADAACSVEIVCADQQPLPAGKLDAFAGSKPLPIWNAVKDMRPGMTSAM